VSAPKLREGRCLFAAWEWRVSRRQRQGLPDSDRGESSSNLGASRYRATRVLDASPGQMAAARSRAVALEIEEAHARGDPGSRAPHGDRVYLQSPPEGDAITGGDEAPRRIGHGTALGESPAVRALVRERGVGVECCPVSNEKMGYRTIVDHPLPTLLAEGLLVSLSTDDPLMFGPFTVGATFDLVARSLGLDDAALDVLTRNGIQTAFVTDGRRSVLERRLEALSAPPSPR
jgi:hypothetical protein